MAHGFVVHRIDLAAGEFRVEFWRDEKLCKAVESVRESLMANLELIIRVIR